MRARWWWWWGGEDTPLVEALGMPAWDAWLHGDVVMETLLQRGARRLDQEAHLDRLVASVQASAGDVNSLQGLRRAFALCDTPAGRLQLYCPPVAQPAAHPRAAMRWSPCAQREGPPPPLRLVTLDLPHPLQGAYGKTVSLHWARSAMRQALRAGADEALLLHEGHALETDHGTLLWRSDQGWHTPDAARCATLPSVTLDALRPALRPSAVWGEALRHPAWIEGVRALYVVSALRRIQPVVSVDGIALSLDEEEAARLWRLSCGGDA
mgnify:CR=1 FL=1